MKAVIGVLGPPDLVDEVGDVCEELAAVETKRFGYRNESETVDLVRANTGDVDGWLFTGVVPYTLAEQADVLRVPAGFVDYTGSTLLQGLVRLMYVGHDVSRISVDTLPVGEVKSALQAAGLPSKRVKVLPYRRGQRSEDVRAFHHRHRKTQGDAAVAITCLRSTYDVLRHEMPALRLKPSLHSIRAALRQLVLALDNRLTEDAQLAIGVIELSGGDEGLREEATSLAASVVALDNDSHLLVTTRGLLVEATSDFTELPMLNRLADHHSTVRAGFGIGRSAAEAEDLARRALTRSRRFGKVAAAVCLRDDTVIRLSAGKASKPATSRRSGGSRNLSVTARRVGLSLDTVQRLQEAGSAAGGGVVTTRDVADRLGVQPRTARRMLNRLERAGAAHRVGLHFTGESGRPLTCYRISL